MELQSQEVKLKKKENGKYNIHEKIEVNGLFNTPSYTENLPPPNILIKFNNLFLLHGLVNISEMLYSEGIYFISITPVEISERIK